MSIKYPYKEDTIPYALLGGILIPFSVIVVSYIHSSHSPFWSVGLMLVLSVNDECITLKAMCVLSPLPEAVICCRWDQSRATRSRRSSLRLSQ